MFKCFAIKQLAPEMKYVEQVVSNCSLGILHFFLYYYKTFEVVNTLNYC